MQRKSVFAIFAGAACVLAVGMSAKAQVTVIRPTLGRPQTVLSAVPGVVINDITVDFVGQLTGFQMLVELTSGSIYQNPSSLVQPGLQPPVQQLEAVDPTIATDTYTAFGGPYAGDNAGNYGLGGGAVGLGGGAAAQFDTVGINQAWNPAGGVVVTDRTDFLAARVALTDDANGIILFEGYAGGQTDVLLLDLPIVNGVIGGAAIPEPSAIVLLSIGLICLAARRRRC